MRDREHADGAAQAACDLLGSSGAADLLRGRAHGYDTHRLITSQRPCEVIAPSLIPRRAGVRVKTDRAAGDQDSCLMTVALNGAASNSDRGS